MSDDGQEIRVNLFGRTDVGQIREHNEDNFLVADLTRKSRSLMEADRNQVIGERGTVMGVCDGMGGAAAGEVASQLAVDIIYEKLAQGGRAHRPRRSRPAPRLRRRGSGHPHLQRSARGPHPTRHGHHVARSRP